MRLERIEINGFKSFSDRSELAFDKGVTAIVGPNGCGKSNVADAITWVMGEQSAKSLRGDRMEDVIFNGSDARKPTAAAEVRLRLSGVLKTVTGPRLTEGAGDAPVHGNGHGNGDGQGDTRGHGAGRGNGHGALQQSDGNGQPGGNGQRVQGSGDGHAGEGATLPATLAGPGAPRRAQALSREEAEELIQSVAREVEVTRRLYRSGESEYLIDGQICRLRDVHELLMDTGLGAKAYSIIEQGKIGMILSTRPTDRRQLIEEAAGVTKYKARRRAAELKLEAAQQNLTRIDDIVFEVDRQRGALRRQAARARRYQRLRDELRRWEKALFARRYRQLAGTIESARARLGAGREREGAAASRLAELESDSGRVRIELVEAESRVTARREAAHATELAISSRQQQIAFDRDQIQQLGARVDAIAAERGVLDARRDPARATLAVRRAAAIEANADRDRAAATLASESTAYESAHRGIEGLEADVEAARSEVFSAINSATALRHSLEHAAAARQRVAEALSRLRAERDDARIEAERAAAEHATAADGLRRARTALEASRTARSDRETALASARIEHEWRSRSLRAREHGLAGLEARLESLRELEAARAGYGDGARAVLAGTNPGVRPRGAVADVLDVEPGFERAVEACLGDLLQHVLVEEAGHAAAGLEQVRDEHAGRCGFLIAGGAPSSGASPEDVAADTPSIPSGLVALSSVVRASGPYAAAVRSALGEAWIADSFAGAATASRTAPCPVATMAGEVFRGPHVVSGGHPAEARGILETKRELRELAGRIDAERNELVRLGEETALYEAAITQASAAIDALNAAQHIEEKNIVGLDAQLQHAAAERSRLAQKVEQLARELRQAEEERDALDARQEEARGSILRLESDQRAADDRLTLAQRRLFETREAADELRTRTADVGASHAALVERAAALAAEVERLEEASADLEARAVALSTEADETARRMDQLRAAVADGVRRLDAGIATLEVQRNDVRAADEQTSALRLRAEELEAAVRSARGSLDSIRAAVAEIDVQRATAESDLAHLAETCLESVQTPLDDVMAQVAADEQTGELAPDAVLMAPDEAEEDAAHVEASLAAERRTLTTEEAIAALKAKIERLGPVNMMAIEQFDELETRHTFLTTQRKDLVDSIAQTTQAINRIDETTRARFAEAFRAINVNFHETFSTLFGGGRAGLALLDENDPLESGIEIIAQPPGKRLQSVQLLSGGEKALTAIALMFALFKYKPSPFCLLDEIDAPLDDANIGRFVEMLRGMLSQTQFILITHNRKTMEIADRLYGVTMEEPGVSKLVSVRLN